METWLGLLALTVAEVPALVLTLKIDGAAPGLETYLVERVRETWDVRVELPNREGAERGVDGADHFAVVVAVQSPAQCSVRISHAGVLLTERTITSRDPTETKLTLWLLLKSTLDRALKRALPEDSDAPGETVQPPRVETASAPSPPALAPAPAGTGAALGETAATDLAASDPATVRFGGLMTLWLETPRLLAAGASLTAALAWRYISAGLELGYRYAPGPNGLQLHGVPLTATVVAEYGDAVWAGFGLMLTGEVKFPVAGARWTLTAGAETGVLAQARVMLRPDMSALLRFAVAWRLVRSRFLYRDTFGVERQTREQAWLSTLSLGVVWQ